MTVALSDPLSAVDYSKCAKYNISDDREALVCEDDEALYPAIENFDNVAKSCDPAPDTMHEGTAASHATVGFMVTRNNLN